MASLDFSTSLSISQLLFNPTFYIILVVAALILSAVKYVIVANREKLYPEFETVGFEKNAFSFGEAKKKFVAQGREFLWAGLQKCQGPFQVISSAGPLIILPSRYVDELKKNDKHLSFNGSLEREFFPHVPGFEGVREPVKNTVVQDSVRIKLTQSLNLITKDIVEETDSALNDIFGNSTEWSSGHFQRICPDLVARLSTRVFLGPVVARDKEWLTIAVDYSIKLMAAARALRLWPSFLQPFIYRLVPEVRALETQTQDARCIIDAEIERRRAKWANDKKNGRSVSKTADSLGWMQELAQGRPFDLAGAQLGLTFAAIHTTSDLITKVMHQLCSYPEYIQPLREEMISVLSKEGWKKTSLYQMKLLDSTLKEVQRLQPPSLATFSRVATNPIPLSDSPPIPRGASIKILTDASHDPSLFPSPQTFDPFRFLRLRAQPGQENAWQFVTPARESLGFGYGMHACPGRFFASNEVKIALCGLLLRYDWRLEGDEVRNVMIATEEVADPMVRVGWRRRREEVDLVGLEGES